MEILWQGICYLNIFGIYWEMTSLRNIVDHRWSQNYWTKQLLLNILDIWHRIQWWFKVQTTWDLRLHQKYLGWWIILGDSLGVVPAGLSFKRTLCSNHITLWETCIYISCIWRVSPITNNMRWVCMKMGHWLQCVAIFNGNMLGNPLDIEVCTLVSAFSNDDQKVG